MAHHDPERDPDVLLRGAAVLVCLAAAVWVVFAWTGYGERYAAALDGWRLGGTHMVEISLVAADREGLACASEARFGPVRCAYDARLRPTGAATEGTLAPFNTVRNQLLLGAGLWSQPVLSGQLPRGRFTVVCNFHVLGAGKALLRWQRTGHFMTIRENAAVGLLSDCELPR